MLKRFQSIKYPKQNSFECKHEIWTIKICFILVFRSYRDFTIERPISSSFWKPIKHFIYKKCGKMISINEFNFQQSMHTHYLVTYFIDTTFLF